MRYRNRYLICSHRIKNWNYASRGWYFITIVTHNRLPLFGHIDNGVMHLNKCGHIVAEEWENSKTIRPYMHFDTYVIMPNHVHFLVQLKHNQHYVPRHLIGKVFRRMSRSIPSFIAAIKRICTIRVRIHHNRPHMRVWQANYHNSIAPPPTSALSGTTSTTIHAMHTTRRTRHFCITIHLITRVDHKDAS